MRVEETDPDGIDYGRVMQLTFVVTIAVGAPLVALLSIPADLPTWADRATFAVRVGAPVWVVTAVGAYLVERRSVRQRERGGESGDETRDGTDVGSDEIGDD